MEKKENVVVTKTKTDIKPLFDINKITEELSKNLNPLVHYEFSVEEKNGAYNVVATPIRYKSVREFIGGILK